MRSHRNLLLTRRRAGLRRRWDLLVVTLGAAADLYVYGGDRVVRWGGDAPVWLVPAVTALAFGLLLSRWQHPIPVFAVQWVHGLAGLVMPGYAPFAGNLIALHAVGCQVRTRVSIALLATSTVPFAINNYNAAVAGGGDVPSRTALLMAAWTVIAAGVWAAGRRTFTAGRKLVVLQDAQAREAAEAVQAERLRLARELHDIVAHAVSAIVLQSAGARTLVGRQDDRVRQALTSIENTGVHAMKELHRLLGLLRSVDPEAADGDVTTQPGLQDVPELIALSRTAGLDVETVVEGHPVELDRSVDLAAFRVIQEALTNATKYGGSGALVRVRQTWGADRLTIVVRSSPGPGHPVTSVPSAGLGLRGLAERVVLVGGRLDVVGREADSFLVRAELPLGTARIGSGGAG